MKSTDDLKFTPWSSPRPAPVSRWYLDNLADTELLHRGRYPDLASAVRADGGKIAWLCRYGDRGGQIDRIICSFKLHTVVTIWTLFTLIHSNKVYLESNHVKPQNRCL